MAVITISRQMGSLGRQAAEEARRLNYRIVGERLSMKLPAGLACQKAALATIDELICWGCAIRSPHSLPQSCA